MQVLKDILRDQGLRDTFRFFRPRSMWATNYTRSEHQSQRRLDRLYVSKDLCKRSASFEQREPRKSSSHDLIQMTLVLDLRAVLKVGRPRFRFPDFLLRTLALLQLLSSHFRYSWDLPAFLLKDIAIQVMRALPSIRRRSPQDYSKSIGEQVMDEYQQTSIDYNCSMKRGGNIISSLRSPALSDAATTTA